MVEEAAKRERANNVSASLPVLEDELELRPVNPRLPAGARNSLYYLLLGYQQRLRGCYGMAVVSLTRSIALSPIDYRPYVNRAYALSRVDRLSDAMHDLEKATELSQTRPENWYNLGLCYQTNQRHQQAIHAFTIALNLLQTYHLSSPWNEERRRDAPMYLSIRCATYKSRSLSLRQERRYREAAMDMMKVKGGSKLKSLPNGLKGSYEAAVRKGTATYFDCGDLYATRGDDDDGVREEKKFEKDTPEMEMAEMVATDELEVVEEKVVEEEEVVVREVVEEEENSDLEKKEKEKKKSENEIKMENDTTTTTPISIWQKLAANISQHTTKDIAALVDIISEVHLLQHLPKKHLQRICQHVKIETFQTNDVIFYQGSRAHCLYVILHGTVSIHLRDSKHAQVVKERTKKNSMEKDVKKDVKKDMKKDVKKDVKKDMKKKEGVKEEQTMEASERRLPAPLPSPPPPHPISWEASKFCCDEPTTRVAGTLQSTGGKYLVTLHPGQAFGEQALAGDDEGKDIPRSASCVSGTFLNLLSLSLS